MISSYHFLVCVRCLTYNHSQYIQKTMDGFAMQQTNFPFVCVIVDDASTDGEQEYIENYLNDFFNLDDISVVEIEESDCYRKIFAQHKINSNCFFKVFLLKYNHYQVGKDKSSYFSNLTDQVKYFAICEGDDYWIDPQKLQKQVGFMETNPSYSLIHTHFLYKNNTSINNDEVLLERMKSYETLKDADIIFGILDSNRYRIQTCTVLYRKSFYDRIVSFLQSETGLFMMGDTQLWVRLLSVGKVKYLQDVTSVYRIVEGSASHSSSLKRKLNFAVSCCEMRYYYASLLKIRKNLFYLRYLKELIKILAIDSKYRTNPRIFANRLDGMITFVVSTPFFVRLAKKVYVDKYLSKLR